MNRKNPYITAKSMRRILAAILIACILFPLSACKGKTVEGDIPVVTYENKEIRINGKFFARSERLTINRIDSRVLSMTTDDGYINLDANGNEIELKDVITNRFIYESTIRKNVDSRLMARSAPLYVDYDAALYSFPLLSLYTMLTLSEPRINGSFIDLSYEVMVFIISS